jgi:predicted negative regulator of RcsB-dependent stress response
MFLKRNALALVFLLTSLALFGVVLWQNNEVEEAKMRSEAANKDIIRLQNEIETWQVRHATMEQALRDCQGELTKTRLLQLIPGPKGKI